MYLTFCIHNTKWRCDHQLEDFHSAQVTKAIVEEYLNLQLFRYGQDLRANIKMIDLGVRQKLTELILFKGL